MQVTLGGNREPLDFEQQQVCAGSMEALEALQADPDPILITRRPHLVSLCS